MQLVLWLILLQQCHSFVGVTCNTRTTALYDIHEWRDIEFNLPGQRADSIVPPKQICLLPFAFPEVLLQGETKQLRLYEERFLKLFEDAMDHHGGLVGMALLADSGIIQTVALCEIEAYNRMEGFGIFCTIRVVGRAQLLGFQQQDPYLKAACLEVVDELPPNLELPNLVASQIENLVLLLSSMEHKLKQAKLKNDEGDDDEEDKEMQRRIELAKLEDTFYADDDEDDDDEDDEESSTVIIDRRKRFHQAYTTALETDTQGYQVVAQQSSVVERTPQELTAISWAAFCTEVYAEADALYRIQALDSANLFERLKLALLLLKQKEKDMKVKLKKSGLNRDDDSNTTSSQ